MESLPRADARHIIVRCGPKKFGGAGGIRTPMASVNVQVVDFKSRSIRKKRQNRISEVHGGYTDRGREHLAVSMHLRVQPTFVQDNVFMSGSESASQHRRTAHCAYLGSPRRTLSLDCSTKRHNDLFPRRATPQALSTRVCPLS